MLHNFKIGSRILIETGLLLVLTILCLLPIVLHQLGAATDRAEARRLEGLYESLVADIDGQKQLATMLSATVASFPDVQESFAARDRDRLKAMTMPIFETLRERYATRQFQFHTPPATSFLRLHMPDRFGDDLSAIRATVVKANTAQTTVSGLERGVAGLGLRGVEPVVYRGRAVGVVEFGLDFGQPFFDTFSQRHGAKAALHIPDKGAFKRFAGTIEDDTLLSDAQARAVMDGTPLRLRVVHRGVPSALYARLIEDFSGQPVGVAELLIDRREAVAAYRTAQASIVGAGLILLTLSLALMWFTSREIARPIREASERLNAIAQGDADLTARLAIRGRNELADLAHAFNAFVDRIQKLVREMAGASAQLSVASEELSLTSGETGAQTRQQQTETDQVATAINEMTATVEEVARHAALAATTVREAERQVRDGGQTLARTIASIEDLSRELEESGQAINRLAGDSQEIGSVLDVIQGVAEQTNLLALNAAIEAARAGEQGRGFAVVAAEVRTLASRTQASIQDIQQRIERVQEGTDAVVRAMVKGEAMTRTSVEQARAAGESFQSIDSAIVKLNDMNTQIASAAEEQAAVAEEVNRNIHNISEAADRTASGTARIVGSSENLARLATELQEQVGRFKV